MDHGGVVRLVARHGVGGDGLAVDSEGRLALLEFGGHFLASREKFFGLGVRVGGEFEGFDGELELGGPTILAHRENLPGGANRAGPVGFLLGERCSLILGLRGLLIEGFD